VANELNHPRFSELQMVSVVVSGVSGIINKEEVIAWIRKEMSCLANRGVLTVTLY
jgi:hypothetical protein